MFDVTSTLVIAAPRERVADFAMNPSNFTKYMDGVRAVELKNPGPLEVGSKFTLEVDGGKKTKSVVCGMLLYEPGYAMRYKYVDGTFPAETTYVFEDTAEPGKTLVKARTKETLTGLNKIASPFLSKGAKQTNDKNLAKLRRLIEHG